MERFTFSAVMTLRIASNHSDKTGRLQVVLFETTEEQMGIARDWTPWLLATACVAAACCAFLWGTQPAEAGEHEVSVWLGMNKEEALLSAPLAVPGTASLGKATAGIAHSVLKTTSAVILAADKGARHAPGEAAKVRVEDLSETHNTDKSL
jgi:hypothetical protein